MKNDNLIPAICPQCGANIELDKNLEQGFCNYCGTKIIIKDIVQKVKIVNNPTLENYIKLAEREYEDKNYGEALEKYERVLEIDPDNWKAVFRRGVCITRTTNLRDFRIGDITKGAKNAINLLNDIDDIKQEEKDKIIVDMCFDIVMAAIDLRSFAMNHYNEYWELENSAPELWDRYAAIINALEYAIIVAEKITNKDITCKSGETVNDIIKVACEMIINACVEICAVRNYKNLGEYAKTWIKEEYRANYVAIYDRYVEKIAGYDINFCPETINRTGNNGCYVATAVYGSYNCPQVWVLRRYRDLVLDETWHGKLFIKMYYKISPTIVKYFGETNIFKKLNRNLLDRFIKKLKNQGFEDTPYKDKY